jgi:KaiC/GvpD/RAD55 family RecA-like ATPase
MKYTILLKSDVSPHSFQFHQYEVEKFITNGIIFLGDVEKKYDLLHTIQVVKMRGTNQGCTKYVLNMDSK